MKRRFAAPIALSDPTSATEIPKVPQGALPKSTSALHQKLVSQLRAKSAEIHKAVLMDIGRPVMDSSSDNLAFVALRKEPKSEVDTNRAQEENPENLKEEHIPEEETNEHVIPDVEWWDKEWYNPLSEQTELSEDISQQIISIKESLPQCSYLTTCEVPLPEKADLLLTSAGLDIKLPRERKKERKQNRADKAREMREKVHKGEAKPNAPKLTMENIQGILKNRKMPAMDPIECEALVIADEVQRRQNHETRNQNAKKTPEERAAKLKAQRLREADDELKMAFYKVEALRGSKETHKNPAFLKIILNVQQLHICGVLAAIGGEHYLLIECGRKPTQKMDGLLRRRMTSVVQCTLLHSGPIASKQCVDFDVKEFHDIAVAKAFLRDKKYGFLLGA